MDVEIQQVYMIACPPHQRWAHSQLTSDIRVYITIYTSHAHMSFNMRSTTLSFDCQILFLKFVKSSFRRIQPLCIICSTAFSNDGLYTELKKVDAEPNRNALIVSMSPIAAGLVMTTLSSSAYLYEFLVCFVTNSGI